LAKRRWHRLQRHKRVVTFVERRVFLTVPMGEAYYETSDVSIASRKLATIVH
jgi:hypothetical protein